MFPKLEPPLAGMILPDSEVNFSRKSLQKRLVQSPGRSPLAMETKTARPFLVGEFSRDSLQNKQDTDEVDPSHKLTAFRMVLRAWVHPNRATWPLSLETRRQKPEAQGPDPSPPTASAPR